MLRAGTQRPSSNFLVRLPIWITWEGVYVFGTSATIRPFLFCDRILDLVVGLITVDTEVRHGEAENVLDFRIDPQRWQFVRFALELLFQLIDVVQVDVQVAESVDEFTRRHANALCHHHRQGGIRRHVERHAQAEVRRHYIQDDSLDHPRTITCSCMSPCRVDYITISNTVLETPPVSTPLGVYSLTR